MKFTTVLMGLVAVTIMASPVFADTLTFPNDRCAAVANGSGAYVACGNSAAINQNYGDSANVNVTYKDINVPGSSLLWWDADYNDLRGVAWAQGGDSFSHARIEFAPLLTGESITINSFDMGAYFHTTRGTNLQISDLVTNAVLFTFTGNVGAEPNHTAFAPNVSSTNGLAIEWSNSAYNVGIDNITFTTSVVTGVPEPGSLTLLGSGVLLLAGYIRRRTS